eukprot:scaffold215860_cov24-Tisochrysis_lutea.AAC.1
MDHRGRRAAEPLEAGAGAQPLALASPASPMRASLTLGALLSSSVPCVPGDRGGARSVRVLAHVSHPGIDGM